MAGLSAEVRRVRPFCRPSRRPECPGHRRPRIGHSAGASIAEAVSSGSVTAAMVSWRLLSRGAPGVYHGLRREWLTNQALALGRVQTEPARGQAAVRPARAIELTQTDGHRSSPSD